MLVAVDVCYREDFPQAHAAAVLFPRWEAGSSLWEHQIPIEQAVAYQPGQFYRRELPCILRLLEEIEQPISTVIIGGYVWLGDEWGLGAHLWNALEQQCPVVGVAKTRYREAPAVEVLRGGSTRPLFVTAAGMEPSEAAERLKRMAGESRVPYLLKRVDQLSRRFQDH